MGKNKYYVVLKGHKKGIFQTIEEAKKNVAKYSGGYFKGFSTIEEAKEFEKNYEINDKKQCVLKKNIEIANKPEDENKGKKEKKRYYVVVRGHNPGLYTEGKLALAQTTGYSDSKMKMFTTKKKADEYINSISKEQNKKQKETKKKKSNRAKVYVDGSFNPITKTASYGCVFIINNKEEYISGCVEDEHNIENIAGELAAARRAIIYCKKNKIKNLRIYYDFEGIEEFSFSESKKQYIKEYREFFDKNTKKLNVSFAKVKAHSGNKYNKKADSIARQALSLDI